MKGVNEKEQIRILKTAFEASYDGIHILDAEGNTLYINKACSIIEGITQEEAMSKNIRCLVADGVYSESVTLKVLEEKKSMTILQKAKNGNQILATGTPIFNEDGEIDKIVVNSRDVTRLNTLEKELMTKEEITKKFQTELELLKREILPQSEMIFKSAIMKRLIKTSMNVAKVESTVLLTGESGVGKGVLARFIHENSNRKGKPFITIDCSAIPASLFESELFGYEKGAFTGAEKTGKVGLLELGNEGTIFLDEIGEMPISMQPKLMRTIQDREIISVGGQKSKKLDIRVIAATNIDLFQMVREKKFREDLYYRINVVPIHIVPLRDRKEDILPLILHTVETINKNYGWSKIISSEALNVLIEYHWPGNVRELENLVERVMVSVIKETLTKEDLPNLSFDIEDEGMVAKNNYKQILARHDYSLLQKAINKEGSIPKAAEKLGVDVTTVRRKIQRYEKEMG